MVCVCVPSLFGLDICSHVFSHRKCLLLIGVLLGIVIFLELECVFTHPLSGMLFVGMTRMYIYPAAL